MYIYIIYIYIIYIFIFIYVHILTNTHTYTFTINLVGEKLESVFCKQTFQLFSFPFISKLQSTSRMHL